MLGWGPFFFTTLLLLWGIFLLSLYLCGSCFNNMNDDFERRLSAMANIQSPAEGKWISRAEL